MSLTIDRAQRTALFLELDHHDLRDLPEIEIAFTHQRYDHAQRLRWDYEAIFRLLDDLHGWNPADTSQEFQLSMPADQLGRVLRRIIRRATRRILKLAAEGIDPSSDRLGRMQQCDEITALCCTLLDQLADTANGV